MSNDPRKAIEAIRTSIPKWAEILPEVATTLATAQLPFYCANCYRKRETAYITPDFGPFCDVCLAQLYSLYAD